MLKARVLNALKRGVEVGQRVPYWRVHSWKDRFVAESYRCQGEQGSDGYPLPPHDMRTGYFANHDRGYVEVGRQEADAFLAFAARHGAAEGRLLDFGCSSGRILRHVVGRSEWSEIYGVDVDTRNIAWATQMLPERLKLVPITSFPSLPFEDRFFDLVIARSVFTHIRELALMCLLEIRRVLRPHGLALITICDGDYSWERYGKTPALFESGAYLARLGFRQDDFAKKRLDADYLVRGFGVDSLVIYNRSYIQGVWGRFMDVLETTPFCPQTTPKVVVVLRKS